MQTLVNALIVAALKNYSDRLGNDGCNDARLPNTKENFELVQAAEGGDDVEVMLTDGGKTICTLNTALVGYVTEHFATANAVDDKLVKQLMNCLS